MGATYFSLHESLTSLITSRPAQSGLNYLGSYRLLFSYYHVCHLYNTPRVPCSYLIPCFRLIPPNSSQWLPQILPTIPNLLKHLQQPTTLRLTIILCFEESLLQLAPACKLLSVIVDLSNLTPCSISRFGFIQQHFWNNARFGTIKDIPALDNIPYRFHVCPVRFSS